MQISDFKILGELGQGGMATVYLAEQISLSRKVALKLLAPHPHDTFMQRFLNEGRIIAKLEHPHIVTIYDVGHVNDQAYIAMELVRGGDLTQRIKERTLTIGMSVHIIKILTEVLGLAHNHGFVHRDIKPSNILFRDNHDPVLTDFGIAKDVGDDQHLTKTGVTIGTPHYMSPEQALGKPVDGRSDLYSLGIMLYEMLTTKLPFQAENSVAMALMHVTETVPPLPSHLTFAQKVIDKILTKDPNQRFQTAEEFRVALEALPTTPEEAAVLTQEIITKRITSNLTLTNHSQLPDQTAPISDPTTNQRSASRGMLWATLGILFTAALLGSSYFFWWQPYHIIQVALAQADLHLQQSQLVTPPGNNAYQRYHEVLSTDPKNKAALAGIQLLLQLLQKQALQQRDQGHLEDSLASISQGLKIEPRHSEFTFLYTEVSKKRDAAKVRQNIADLLAKATQQRKNDFWVSPAKNNALETYHRILAEAPNNKPAKAGLSTIAHHFEVLAQAQQATGQYKQSQLLIQRGLQAEPKSPGLLRLQQNIERANDGTPIPPDPLESLLAQATKQLGYGRLSGRTGALHLYRKILSQDDDNAAALEGIEAVADRYVALAKAQRNKNLAKAINFLDKGLAIRPDDGNWQNLREQFKSALQEQKRQAELQKKEQLRQQKEKQAQQEKLQKEKQAQQEKLQQKQLANAKPPKLTIIGPRLIGAISNIDREWGFVVFRLDTSAAVKVGEYVYTKEGGKKRLKVSRISDRNISASPEGGIGNLRTGMKIYSD